MKKILFVCLGNICRSPLAEGIMLKLNRDESLNLFIDSAGTANYHAGEAPDPRTIANAAKHNVDLKPLRARQFEKKDFAEFDLILCMDKSNLHNVKKLNSGNENKIHLFLEFALGNKNAEVPDPYYGTEKDFEEVFQLTEKACLSLVSKLIY